MFYYYAVEPVNQNFTGIVLEILGCLTEPWNATNMPQNTMNSSPWL